MPRRHRRRYAMAGRRPRRSFRSRFKSKKIPIAPLVGLATLFTTTTPSGHTLLNDAMSGDMNLLMYDAREQLLGVDNTGKFQWSWMAEHYTPLVVGIIAHLLANKFGINRYFNKVPVIGKYLAI